MNNDDQNEFELDFVDDALLEAPTVQTGAVNGNFPAEVMQQIPCTIAFTYARFYPDGTVKPCCVAPFTLGDTNQKGFEDIWHSAEYNAWRSKFLSIHKKKFHLHNTEFSFCQICPHISANTDFVKNLSAPLED